MQRRRRFQHHHRAWHTAWNRDVQQCWRCCCCCARSGTTTSEKSTRATTTVSERASTPDQSDEGRGYIPPGWTNQMRGAGIYTHRADQSDEGRGYIPTGRTNQMRGEYIYPQGGPIR
eukprot:1188391-Prorocentrum_minimum.AAC.2